MLSNLIIIDTILALHNVMYLYISFTDYFLADKIPLLINYLQQK